MAVGVLERFLSVRAEKCTEDTGNAQSREPGSALVCWRLWWAVWYNTANPLELFLFIMLLILNNVYRCIFRDLLPLQNFSQTQLIPEPKKLQSTHWSLSRHVDLVFVSRLWEMWRQTSYPHWLSTYLGNGRNSTQVEFINIVNCVVKSELLSTITRGQGLWERKTVSQLQGA